jgi:hypothetical protein
MQFSDEDLIAFLLGDASPELSHQIEQSLAGDLMLVERLSDLRRVLGQIDSLGCVYEPPADLVDATLARIDAAASECDLHPCQPSSLTNSSLAAMGGKEVRQRSALWDSSALTICLTFLCCLALPALVEVRFQSRKAQCAQHLERTGFGLIEFALNNPSQRFPFVALEGPEAFAGVYAIRLSEFGIPMTPEQLSCASLLGYSTDTDSIQLESVPSIADLRQFSPGQLKLVQQSVGGDYAYNLGIQEEGRVYAPKYEGRSQFAILADAPAIVGNSEQFIAHDGRGINIFFDDGRVAFVSIQAFSSPQASTSPLLNDNPFRNLLGDHEVGLHREDASLAPSPFPPVGN